MEAVSSGPTLPRAPRRATTPVRLKAPETAWFVRATFPGVVPNRASTERLFASHGLRVEAVTEAEGATRWLRLGTATRQELSKGLTAVRETHRVDTAGVRAV